LQTQNVLTSSQRTDRSVRCTSSGRRCLRAPTLNRLNPAPFEHAKTFSAATPATAAAMDADPSRQVRVRFFTNLPSPLRVPTTAIAVPADLSRMGLSEIVNGLLAVGERLEGLEPQPSIPSVGCPPWGSNPLCFCFFFLQLSRTTRRGHSTSLWTASSCGCRSSSSSTPRAFRRFDFFYHSRRFVATAGHYCE
jgi:hypothetical protein